MRFLSPPRPQQTPSPRLRLEALDDRSCPCATGQLGDTLFITGDRAAERIAIDQSGDRVQVSCDDEPVQTFTGVFHVVVNTWAGDDSINVDYGPTESREPVEVQRTWDIRTGAGNDHVTVHLTPGPDDDLVCRVDLGAGDDALQATVTQKVDTETPAPPAGDVLLDVRGRDGDDQVQITFGGSDDSPQSQLFSSAVVGIDAGAGTNAVGVVIVGSEFLGPVDLKCASGFDDDKINLTLKQSTFLGPVDLAVATGAGADAEGITIEGSKSLGPVDLRCATGFGDDKVNFTFKKWEFDGSLAVGIDTGAGNDEVNVTFGDILSNTDVQAGLGAGDDKFTASFFPTETISPAPLSPPPGLCKIDVFGQQGNDRLSVFLAGPDTLPPEQQLFNTALTANLDGGGGANTAMFEIKDLVANAPMSLSYNGGFGDEVMVWDWRDVTVNAPVTQSMNLGGGNDVAAVNAFNVAFDAAATQKVNLGDGADNAGFIYFNVSTNANVLTDIMGGADPDTIYVTGEGTTVATGGSLAMNADAGGGADTIAQTWWATTVAPGASVMVDVDGGGGRDVISTDVIGGTVARAARFDVEVHGDDGADVLRLSSVGLLVESDGGADWCLDGNGGNDVIDARIDLDANSRGTVDVEVMGSAGDDDLTLGISGIGDANQLTALVDGGAGHDTAHVSRILLPFVVNCEEVFVLE